MPDSGGVIIVSGIITIFMIMITMEIESRLRRLSQH